MNTQPILQPGDTVGNLSKTSAEKSPPIRS